MTATPPATAAGLGAQSGGRENAMSELNPQNTMLIVKDETGREVGRIAATAPNASDYMQELARHYDKISVGYEEDKDAAMVSRMLNRR